jgi:hypothetical protein
MNTNFISLMIAGTASIFLSLAGSAGAQAPDYRPLSLSAEAGTTGVGGALRFRFSDHFGVRGGGNWFEYSENGQEIEGVTYNAKLRLQSEPLTLDIYPWKKHSFYVSVGALFNQHRLTGTAPGGQSVTVGGTDFVLGPNESLELKVEQQPVAPYLSIGGNFFYFDRGQHLSLGGELGVFYGGDPKVSLTSTSAAIPQSALDAEVQEVRNKANDYKFWPVLKLVLTYAF